MKSISDLTRPSNASLLFSMRSELQLKRRSTDIKVPLDGVFNYCQDFNNSGWFQKSRTRLVDGYCFRRVDTNINKNSNRLSSVFIATGELSVCVCARPRGRVGACTDCPPLSCHSAVYPRPLHIRYSRVTLWSERPKKSTATCYYGTVGAEERTGVWEA